MATAHAEDEHLSEPYNIMSQFADLSELESSSDDNGDT